MEGGIFVYTIPGSLEPALPGRGQGLRPLAGEVKEKELLGPRRVHRLSGPFAVQDMYNAGSHTRTAHSATHKDTLET